MSYNAPIKDMLFTLSHVANLPEIMETERFAELDMELAEALLEQSAEFNRDVIAPLNQVGDTQGIQFESGAVTTALGWKQGYTQWADGGWNGISAPEQWGGAGLPLMLGTATMEMLTSACMAMGLGPVLSQGAADTLMEHASPELAAEYLEKLISGEWTATMNITEPQAGSDLSGIRTKAEPQDDGSYRIFGQKIFITYGEHDMTDNIIHLVLARLPDAPEGTRGLSLFLVPKMLSDGLANDVQCGGVEEKLGLHGSPTCTMLFGENGGAIGWLVGKENQGLKCMFTMMNRARLATGLQGVAIAERAWQQSLDYAQQRKQGTDPATGEKCAIITHPDVQRMLLTMRSLTAASRGLAYYAAGMIDQVESGNGDEYGARANLLTPIVKAWCSEIGFEVASIGIQVHGGYGFVEETGAAQHLRDIRIASIYEGTNAIQAIDLINRKVRMTAGEPVEALLNEWRDDLAHLQACDNADLSVLSEAYQESLGSLEQATQWVLVAERAMPELLSVANDYLQLFGNVAGHAMLIKAAVAADKLRESDPEYAAKWASLAVFYTRQIATKNVGYLKTVLQGSGALGMAGLVI